MRVTLEIPDYFVNFHFFTDEDGKQYFRPGLVPRWVIFEVIEEKKKPGRPKKTATEEDKSEVKEIVEGKDDAAK